MDHFSEEKKRTLNLLKVIVVIVVLVLLGLPWEAALLILFLALLIIARPIRSKHQLPMAVRRRRPGIIHQMVTNLFSLIIGKRKK